MSKELIEKLKKLIEKVEKISKGGPGSGPREGQRNRAGTGRGPNNMQAKYKVNGQSYNPNFYINGSTSKKWMHDSLTQVDNIKEFAAYTKEQYKEELLNTITDGILGQVATDETNWDSDAKKVKDTLRNNKYLNAKVNATYGQFKRMATKLANERK